MKRTINQIGLDYYNTRDTKNNKIKNIIANIITEKEEYLELYSNVK